jgi:fructosamine-3-kinase
MFEGEFESLKELDKTGIIRVPKPVKALQLANGQGALLVMEYLKIENLGPKAQELGRQLAM